MSEDDLDNKEVSAEALEILQEGKPGSFWATLDNQLPKDANLWTNMRPAWPVLVAAFVNTASASDESDCAIARDTLLAAAEKDGLKHRVEARSNVVPGRTSKEPVYETKPPNVLSMTEDPRNAVPNETALTSPKAVRILKAHFKGMLEPDDPMLIFFGDGGKDRIEGEVAEHRPKYGRMVLRLHQMFPQGSHKDREESLAIIEAMAEAQGLDWKKIYEQGRGGRD